MGYFLTAAEVVAEKAAPSAIENFLNQMSNVVGTLGAIVLIPVILFVICLISGVTVEKSFRSALLCAVGLQGFNLVINSYGGIIAPVVDQMVKGVGVNLPCIDTGWQSVSVIAYATTVGILFIGVALVIQLVLFLLKWTDVFMASDLWNNYSFMVWGSMIYELQKKTMGNGAAMGLAMACMITQLLFILLFSEVIAKRWSTHYQYPNCCMTAPHHMEAVPFAMGMNWLLNKIGLNKVKVDAASIQKKFGLFGEPMFIGLVVGLIVGILGNVRVPVYEEGVMIATTNNLTTLAGWGTIMAVAISTSAIMVVFPKVGAVFASAFTFLTDAFRAKAAKSGENREWYLAVNDAAGYGETNTLTTGVLLIPIMLGLSFVLPGNRMLPMADLGALPYMVEVFVCTSHGNVPKSLIMGAIWFSIGLVVCSSLAPTFTDIARSVGFEIPGTATFIMSFGIMAHPFMAGLFFAFWKFGFIVLIPLLGIYFALYFVFKKNRQAVYAWLESNGGVADTK